MQCNIVGMQSVQGIFEAQYFRNVKCFVLLDFPRMQVCIEEQIRTDARIGQLNVNKSTN